MLQEAKEVAKIQAELDRSMREYDAAHKFSPMPMGPSRLGRVRNRGKHLNKEIQKEARPQASSTPSVVSVPRKKYSMPSYNSPAKALRAAQAAMAELANLAGEARRSSRPESMSWCRSQPG